MHLDTIKLATTLLSLCTLAGALVANPVEARNNLVPLLLESSY